MPQPQKKTGLCVNSLIRSELALVSLRMLRAWLLSGFFLGGELGGFGAVTHVLQVGSFVGGSAVSIGKQVGRIGG